MTGLGGGQRVAKDSPAGERLRHGRRAQLADRRRARDRACTRAADDRARAASRTSCSTSGRTCAAPADEPGARAGSRPSSRATSRRSSGSSTSSTRSSGRSTNFLLPGGSPGAAQLHVARTICRRAEREAIDARARRADRRARSSLPQPPVRRAVRDGPLREPRARRRRTAVEARNLMSHAVEDPGRLLGYRRRQRTTTMHGPISAERRARLAARPTRRPVASGITRPANRPGRHRPDRRIAGVGSEEPRRGAPRSSAAAERRSGRRCDRQAVTRAVRRPVPARSSRIPPSWISQGRAARPPTRAGYVAVRRQRHRPRPNR